MLWLLLLLLLFCPGGTYFFSALFFLFFGAFSLHLLFLLGGMGRRAKKYATQGVLDLVLNQIPNPEPGFCLITNRTSQLTSWKTFTSIGSTTIDLFKNSGLCPQDLSMTKLASNHMVLMNEPLKQWLYASWHSCKRPLPTFTAHKRYRPYTCNQHIGKKGRYHLLSTDIYWVDSTCSFVIFPQKITTFVPFEHRSLGVEGVICLGGLVGINP